MAAERVQEASWMRSWLPPGSRAPAARPAARGRTNSPSPRLEASWGRVTEPPPLWAVPGAEPVADGRLPRWLRLCPYPQARGGSAPCRLRAQVVPRGLDPCDSPAAPGHARTSRLARWKPVPAHRPRRSGTRKGAGHGVERAKVPKRSWASRTGAASWAFLHCTHLHSPREDGLLRRTQLTLLLDWAELSEVESRQSDEAVAFSVRLGDLNFDNCALTNAAEILPSPPLRGLLRGDAEGLGAGGRAPPLPGRPSLSTGGPAPGLRHLPRRTRRRSEPSMRQSPELRVLGLLALGRPLNLTPAPKRWNG
ncbi:uncharacterized protein SMPD5 [Neophocaena asiaeorientalis asiaeorientalis]|uniref:Uncharacterized protein SMPD5 n=1 Tax=Neophocaena asiaeorientalis asiaeorientalis TaxID=1706337 RepID=A0A341B5C1_NEOAA|nr:uncharacterized protein SMPD5 [Neophocaena asiaeorientalis asiaeorientalis]